MLQLKYGLTALYNAAGSDYGASAVETLLEHGADINAKYLSGLTALHQGQPRSNKSYRGVTGARCQSGC